MKFCFQIKPVNRNRTRSSPSTRVWQKYDVWHRGLHPYHRGYEPRGQRQLLDLYAWQTREEFQYTCLAAEHADVGQPIRLAPANGGYDGYDRELPPDHCRQRCPLTVGEADFTGWHSPLPSHCPRRCFFLGCMLLRLSPHQSRKNS